MLPLAFGPQLGDLTILVDRNDRERIHGRTRRQVCLESRGGQGPAMRRGLEQPHQVVAVLAVQQRRWERRVIEPHGTQPALDVLYEATRTGRILERELPILTGADDGDVGP